MKEYYPVNLDITDKRCVVIGGGEVAARKIKRLLACGARITVVSRVLTPSLAVCKASGSIAHVNGDYDAQALNGAFMVIGATDCPDVNERISTDAMAKGLLVNIVDDPDRCNFILPSIVRQGDLSIAVSTGGKSPALAKKLRKELEAQYGDEYRILVGIMGELRKLVLAQGLASEDNKRIFEKLVHTDILQAIREKNGDRVHKLIRDIAGIGMEVRI